MDNNNPDSSGESIISQLASSEPVWKRPAWITAMVGVVTALITIPEHVGNYYAKEQEIRLAHQQVEKVKEEVKAERQDRVLETTLEQSGRERIFVLRYLAQTSDDGSKTKAWAEQEVATLERLAELETEVRVAEAQAIANGDEILPGAGDGTDWLGGIEPGSGDLGGIPGDWDTVPPDESIEADWDPTAAAQAKLLEEQKKAGVTPGLF